MTGGEWFWNLLDLESVSVLYKNLLGKLYKIQIISELWNLIKLPNRILWSKEGFISFAFFFNFLTFKKSIYGTKSKLWATFRHYNHLKIYGLRRLQKGSMTGQIYVWGVLRRKQKWKRQIFVELPVPNKIRSLKGSTADSVIIYRWLNLRLEDGTGTKFLIEKNL